MLETAKNKKTKKLRSAAPAVADLFLEVVPGAMKELRRMGRGFENSSLTIPQFRILACLGCEWAATNKSLAESTGVSVAATSRMVDLLVKRGLVVRLQGTKDRREIELRLSPKGLQEFETVRIFIRKRLAERLELVPEKELLKAAQGLKALQGMLTLLYRANQ
jgi:DNA-binding MarR family transcriptional regulator